MNGIKNVLPKAFIFSLAFFLWPLAFLKIFEAI